jgi:hypothetical protein
LNFWDFFGPRVSAAMVTSVPVEDRLDGASNFNSWKSRLLITLEESDLMKFVEEVVPEPDDASEKSQWKKNDARARRIIIYSVRDHLIPHISKLKTTKEMFDALKKLFESNNTNRAIALKHQLQNVKMTKADTIATFFMKISEIRDQLGTIGEIISDRELVMLTLNGLPSHWEPFIQSISGRSKLPKFDRLWADCTQEETRLAARGAQGSHHDESHALASHARKGKGRGRGSDKPFKGGKSRPTPEHKKKDLSKIQCFKCEKFGHYARHCPLWKNRKQHASTADVDREPPQKKSRKASKDDEEFFFISSLSGTIPTSSDIWLIDSGASRHMTGYREHLTDLVEKDSRLHVVLGDDARYTVKGSGATSFQLDSGTPLHLSDVLFVPGMRRNLVSISALEDKGYKVSFSDGKVLAWHKNSSMESARVIGVREDSLYRLTV